jgi:hypothetical protein
MPHAYTEDHLVELPAKAGGPPSPWSSPKLRTLTPTLSQWERGRVGVIRTGAKMRLRVFTLDDMFTEP